MNPLILEVLLNLDSKKSLITIDGAAGSGKTTLASECEDSLRSAGFSVITIHMDDLYNGWTNALTPTLSQTLTSIIEGFESGEITFASYDWRQGAFTEPRSFTSPDILILEGVGSGQKSIRNAVALSIWIEMDPRTAFERVIARDGEGVSQYMNQWLLDQEAHFRAEGTRGAADYCIDGAP
jgi:uridine kinase